jgi:hypothetical protein
MALRMSFEALNAVWDRSTRRRTELLVLLAIADYVNAEKGVAWPGVPNLAKKARLSERQLQRIIRILERSGELQVSRAAGPGGTNLYSICLSAENTGKGEDIVAGDKSSNQAVSSASSKGDTPATQSLNEPILERTPVVPKGELEFWIQVCFDCFRQPVRHVREYVVRRLQLGVPTLDRGHAKSLVDFYRSEPLDSKLPLFSSRKHSVERLLLDLPRQLALAVQAFPPKKKKVHDFTIEDVHQYLRRKYGDCLVPASLEDLDESWEWETIRGEVYAAMRNRKSSQVEQKNAESEARQTDGAGKKEPPRWREFFRWKYPECLLPKSFDTLSFELRGEYQREHQNFLAQTGETGAKVTLR